MDITDLIGLVIWTIGTITVTVAEMIPGTQLTMAVGAGIMLGTAISIWIVNLMISKQPPKIPPQFGGGGITKSPVRDGSSKSKEK